MEGLCSVMVYLSVRTQRYHCMSVTYALCLPEHPCMRVAGLHGLSMHAHERAAALICSPYMVGVNNLRLAKKVAESMMSYLISFILLKPGKPGNQTPIVDTCFVLHCTSMGQMLQSCCTGQLLQSSTGVPGCSLTGHRRQMHRSGKMDAPQTGHDGQAGAWSLRAGHWGVLPTAPCPKSFRASLQGTSWPQQRAWAWASSSSASRHDPCPWVLMSPTLPLVACPQGWSDQQPWEDWNRCLPAPQLPCSSLQHSTACSALLLQDSSRDDGGVSFDPCVCHNQLEAAEALRKAAAAAAAAENVEGETTLEGLPVLSCSVTGLMTALLLCLL